MKIAISGPMCSGKTTIANLIYSLKPEYNIYSFGKKIKDLAKELFNMDEVKDRSLLINIANKMKDINQNVWIDYVMKKCNNDNNCIIDDLRFENELNVLKNDTENDWHFIVLQVPKELRIKRIMKLYPDNYQDHINNMDDISEKGLIDFPLGRTLYLNTNDTLDDIYESLNGFL